MTTVQDGIATGEVEVAYQRVGAVRLHVTGRNTPVAVEHVPAPLQVVGFGTDAVVVSHPLLPGRVFKVYAPERLARLDDELECYRRLAGSAYFATCCGRGGSFLELSPERGPTLLDCLLQGVVVPPSAIEAVEAAREEVRRVGLYPRDIHLKNIVLQGGGVKVLDLAKYHMPGEDRLWDPLALGYRTVYPLVEGRRVPMPLIELTKRLYRAGRVRRRLRYGTHRTSVPVLSPDQ